MSDDLAEQILPNAKEFRYENLIFKYTKSRDTDTITGYIVKNTETPYVHYHFYVKDEKLYFHQTLNGEIGKQHIPIDAELALQKLRTSVENFLNKAELVHLTDEKFTGRNIVLLQKFNIQVDQTKGKKVHFAHNLDLNECLFEEIDLTKNGMGAIFDENDHETHIIIVKDGQIAVIDLKHLDEDSDEVNSIMNPIGNN